MLHLTFPFFLLLMLHSEAIAQYWVGSLGINYGRYSMQSAKEFQSTIGSSAVPLESVESFPDRLGFDGSILRSFGKFSLGTYFSTASTGGRVSYADYSGSINNDIIANNWVVAVQLEGAIVKKDTWELFFSFRNGFSFNAMKYIQAAQIGSDTYSSEEKYKSIDIMISPGLGSRIFYKNFFLHPEVRYESHVIKGDLHYDGADDVFLEVNGERVQLGWDGVRIGFSIGYRI
jgi:hypothetical protein